MFKNKFISNTKFFQLSSFVNVNTHKCFLKDSFESLNENLVLVTLLNQNK